MARFDDMMELRRLNVKLQEHDEVQKKAGQRRLVGKKIRPPYPAA